MRLCSALCSNAECGFHFASSFNQCTNLCFAYNQAVQSGSALRLHPQEPAAARLHSHASQSRVVLPQGHNALHQKLECALIM